jgi:hypothetical protein
VRGERAPATEGEAHAGAHAEPDAVSFSLPVSRTWPCEGSAARLMKINIGSLLANLPRWIEAARRAKKAAGQIVNRIRGRKPNVAQPDAGGK